MTGDDPQKRLTEIFVKASGLPVEQRAAYLDDACGDDQDLRQEVESLLADDRSTADLAVTPDAVGRPEKIGPYRILQKLGEGGMGVVFEAEQDRPVRRKVALKVIKAGMDTAQVIARFEAERQALALMDHTHVARVYDAGTTPEGHPYFAMEYVRGVPINEHCDRQRLNTRERLELFMKVCDGVQHAHQKAIIHRDLKPSNILVSIEGEQAVPKIIDFGVAKATAQRLTERTLFTELGQMVGTPAYMSPEQAEMSGQDVDTRTDVYSLGVLLYELLVGALPFDPKELRGAGFDEMRRRIREVEPSRPSTRLSTLGEASTESAHRRRSEPRALARQLRGDLDWITMRALEKDRIRRYGSPNELAQDVRRHLNDEPVIAGPPSVAYRAKKYVRRHRVGVALATVALLLLAGIAARERLQSNRIAEEARTAEQALEFLVGLFEVSDPSEARGNSLTAREVLDKGATKIDKDLADQPVVQARLMHAIGEVYLKLGLYAEAEPLLERAMETRKRALGDDHPDTLRAMNDRANLDVLRERYDEAEPLYREVLEGRKRVLGENHRDTLKTMNNVALVLAGRGQVAEAEAVYSELLERWRSTFGREDPETIGLMVNLAKQYLSQGRYEEAEALLLEASEFGTRVLGNDHPSTLKSVGGLADVYLNQGRFEEAEPLILDNVDIAKRVLGADHPDTIGYMWDLFNLHRVLGRPEDMESLLLDIIERQERVLGATHSSTVYSKNTLANDYVGLGRSDEAEAIYVGLVESFERTKGPDDPDSLMAKDNLARLQANQGRFVEAEPRLEAILAARRRVLGADHPHTLSSLDALAVVYSMQGRYGAIEPLYIEALERRRHSLGEDDPETLTSTYNLLSLYWALGRHSEAEPLAVELLEKRRRVLGANHPDTLDTLTGLATVYQSQGRFDEAEKLHREVLEAQERTLGGATANALYGVACLEALRGDRTKAMEWLRRSVDAGWPDADWLARDPDFESLHGPEFDALVRRVRENAASPAAD